MLNEPQHSKLALWFALFLTVGISVIKGGVPVWVSLSWASLCGITLCLILLLKKSATDIGTHQSLKRERRYSNPLFLLILFQAWAVFQYGVNSFDAPASLNKLFIGFGMVCLLVTWKSALKHSNALNKLFSTIILFSFIQALYGLWIFLSGTNALLWMPKLYYLDRPTGFFVNANHFAIYTVLALILCISSIIASKSSKLKPFLIRLFDYAYNPKSIILLFLSASLIASKSIGAITALVSVLGLIYINVIWHSKQRKKLLLATASVAFLFFFMVLSLDYSVIDKEISGLSHTFSRRYALSEAAFNILKDNWLLGTGGGSFYSQFSPYRTLEVGNSYYNYAHNDLLQFWIEYGLIGVTLLVLFLTSALRDNIHLLRQRHTAMQATFAYTSIYTTVAVMVHSLVDFPLHIPGFSVCYIVVIMVNSLGYKDTNTI